MMKPEEKAIVVRAFGSNYIAPLEKHLKTTSLRNARGNYFSNISIGHFVNGQRENLEVEMEILLHAKNTIELKRQEAKEIAKARREIIKTAK